MVAVQFVALLWPWKPRMQLMFHATFKAESPINEIGWGVYSEIIMYMKINTGDLNFNDWTSFSEQVRTYAKSPTLLTGCTTVINKMMLRSYSYLWAIPIEYKAHIGMVE